MKKIHTKKAEINRHLFLYFRALMIDERLIAGETPQFRTEKAAIFTQSDDLKLARSCEFFRDLALNRSR